jgi:hypothetical protein
MGCKLIIFFLDFLLSTFGGMGMGVVVEDEDRLTGAASH